ncbi:MAG: LuxR C-terminal-related transcriptional regulator [Pseudolabrys sp.]
MTQTNSRFSVLSPPTQNFPPQTFNQLQNELVSRARLWAVDEVGAAMAHQLNEPLTALLLYLHELKDRGERSNGTETNAPSTHDMVKLALCETERVCDIMQRLGHPFEAPPVNAETAVARGRAAIDSWAQNGSREKAARPTTNIRPHTIDQLLTPREREVLTLITGGASNKEGGRRMGISTRTFEVHRAHVMEKLGARNAADLVRIALSEAR